jgi:hypothetical protein
MYLFLVVVVFLNCRHFPILSITLELGHEFTRKFGRTVKIPAGKFIIIHETI